MSENGKSFLNLIQKRKYTLTFTEPILGMSPLNKQIHTDFILKKAREKHPEIPKERFEDEAEMIQDLTEERTTGFHRDAEGVYLGDWQFRGFLKTAANNLKNIFGIKNFKSKLENYVFVFPRWIWLKEEIDGKFERPLRAETAKGPRTSLACSEMINAGVTIEIELHLLPHPEITWNVIEQLLDYGRYEGVSQFRSASYGRFLWENKGLS